mgnify:CR=1 FL=1
MNWGKRSGWCILVFRDIQDEFLQEQQRNLEITQLATAAGFAYQMLISINLTKKTYHMLEYERYPVVRPGTEGNFDDLIEAELATVHPDHREEFREKFSYFPWSMRFPEESGLSPWRCHIRGKTEVSLVFYTGSACGQPLLR